MTMNRVIGVDLGGTKILAGVIEDGRVLQTVERPTPTTSQDALFDGLAEAVRELPLDGVDAVGFGIPSRFDYRTGHALGAVNIPLREVDFVAAMKRAARPAGRRRERRELRRVCRACARSGARNVRTSGP